MFPGPDSAASRRSHLLHACGDVSGLTAENSIFSQSAPRMWRCFYQSEHSKKVSLICSTHVEMFPTRCCAWRSSSDLLHACGDVSTVPRPLDQLGESAPRMWRCFRTGAEGVVEAEESAPRMWRCFHAGALETPVSKICSTHVEMFLWATMRMIGGAHLLHACGDVSHSASKTSLIL